MKLNIDKIKVRSVWTLLYVSSSSLAVAWVLKQFTASLAFSHRMPDGFWVECIAAWLQLMIQALFILKRGWKPILRYWNLNMSISGIGAVLLLPLVAFSDKLNALHPWLMLIGFSCVVFTMVFLHHKALQRFSLPLYLSLTWLSYRVLLLCWILPYFL